MYARLTLVKINTIAQPHVTRVMKFPAPRPPKTCWLAPPKALPRPPPRPCWRSTTRIRNMQTSTWMMLRRVVMVLPFGGLSYPTLARRAAPSYSALPPCLVELDEQLERSRFSPAVHLEISVERENPPGAELAGHTHEAGVGQVHRYAGVALEQRPHR